MATSTAVPHKKRAIMRIAPRKRSPASAFSPSSGAFPVATSRSSSGVGEASSSSERLRSAVSRKIVLNSSLR